MGPACALQPVRCPHQRKTVMCLMSQSVSCTVTEVGHLRHPRGREEQGLRLQETLSRLPAPFTSESP